MIGQDYWWVLLIKAVVVILGLTTIAAYLTYAERKVAARIQLRIGPNRVGPFGLLQPAADAVKNFLAELGEFRPSMVDHRLRHGAQHAIGYVGWAGNLQEMTACVHHDE